MFQKLLIANRGEIACRVIRTARAMGLETIAVHSDADASALHVRLADRAYSIGGARAEESYLNGDRILEVAKRAGAGAIHPGYGFLSENADFAEACEAAGIRFVGPPPAAIRVMGEKHAAKRSMEAAGVPVVPGEHGDGIDAEVIAKAGERIGYPLLLKAVAGGGGRGMRRIESASGIDEALAAVRREAKSSFGDDRVLVEKAIECARHVEVQVFADDHGNVVHLFERDCSMQRRHQKVIEEAPAPGMSESLRAAMGEAAAEAARAIGYRGAGTVEFLVEVPKRGERVATELVDAPFYFMEMNTRLQVEHPITEAITGLDLVECQLRVAQGLPLPDEALRASLRGHAVEVRLYAEDPARGFLPQTGHLVHLRFPEARDGIRIDTGVEAGDDVSHFYDPMIAKLVAWGPDRPGALARLSRALEETEIAGVTTNRSFLHRLLAEPDFAAGRLDTRLLERRSEHLQPEPAPSAQLIALACAAVLAARDDETSVDAADPDSPWRATDAFRTGPRARERLHFERLDGPRRKKRAAGERLEVDVHHEGDTIRLAWGDEDRALEAPRLDAGVVSCRIDGVRQRATHRAVGRDGSFLVQRGIEQILLRKAPALAREAEAASGDGIVRAPIPGRIIEVCVEEGARVGSGQLLVRLEAMKVEHALLAETKGIVRGLAAFVGQQVEEGAPLLRIEAG